MAAAVQPLEVVVPGSELLLLPGKSVEQPDAIRRSEREREIDRRDKADLLSQIERRASVLRAADDVDVALDREQRGQRAEHHLLVFGNHHANHETAVPRAIGRLMVRRTPASASFQRAM